MMMRSSLRYLVASALLVACGGSDDQPDSDAADGVDTDVADGADGATDAPGPGEDTLLPDVDGPDDVEPDIDVADAADAASPDVADVETPDAADVEDTDTVVVDVGADADVADVVDAADVDAVDAADVADADVVEPETGSIAGTVHVALTAQTVPVAGATVRAGGVTTTTDADGRFLLAGVESSVRVRVDVSVDGPDAFYSSSSRMVGVAADGLTKVRFELAEGCAATVDVSSGPGVVLPADCGPLGGLAGIELPQNGVVDEDGTPVSEVRVVMVPLPLRGGGASSGDAMLVFPGDMRAEPSGDEDITLESRGAMEVRLSEPVTGRPLQLAAGATATIVFPAMADSLDDDMRGSPLWWYDEDAGMWLELSEATTTIEVEPFGDRLLHRAEVPHFTWWNADIPMSRSCVTGRLVDTEGAPLVTRSVAAIGVDYLGATWATSDSDGRFFVPVRRSSNVVVSASVEIGAASVAVRRFVTTRPDETSCTDVGDLVLDTTSIAACAAGRVLDVDGATPVSGAEVTAFNGRQVLRTVSGTDGRFCLPVPSAETYEVAASIRADEGVRIGRRDGLSGVAGSGFCAATGDDCASLGDIVLRAPACVRGTVGDAADVVNGVVVEVTGRRGSAYAVTGADGGWCVQMEQNDIVDVVARQRNFTGSTVQSGANLDVFMPSSAGTCADGGSCQVINVVIGQRGCVSGVAETDGGEPLANARVLVSAGDGRDPLRVVTDASGNFCAPAIAGSTTRVDVLQVDGGVRFATSSVVDVPAGAASCALDTCVDVGTLRAAGVSAATCVRGRLLDEAPLPFRRTATLVSDAGAQAIRPEPDGSFCVELPASTTITIRDDEFTGCVEPRQVDFVTADAPDASCADRSGCFDVGDVDFDDFCFSS